MNNCSIEGCDEISRCKGMCRRHYMQFKTYGKILERTRSDPNEFIIDGNITWILLCNRKREEVARAKFNTKYYEQIKDYKWHLHGTGYVCANWYDENKQYEMRLHQAIVELSGQKVPDGYEIDHKDGDKLNCLEDNLRICTHAQNNHNRRKNQNSTSGQKGVSWSKQAKKSEGYISVNNKRIHLGYFDDPKDAAKAYNAAAIKYHGEFAQLNEI
jgi:hypothetical protein